MWTHILNARLYETDCDEYRTLQAITFNPDNVDQWATVWQAWHVYSNMVLTTAKEDDNSWFRCHVLKEQRTNGAGHQTLRDCELVLHMRCGSKLHAVH